MGTKDRGKVQQQFFRLPRAIAADPSIVHGDVL